VIVCLAVAAFVVCCSGEGGSCGEKCLWTFTNSTGHLSISGSGRMATAEGWKDLKKYIKSVEVGGTITNIVEDAFRYCYWLESVEIGSSVTSIESHAFSRCEMLKEITIPSRVTTLGDNAFDNCGLTSVTIPSSVSKMGDYVFSFCYSLESAVFVDGAKTTGDHTFDSCRNLTSVTIPGSVRTIGAALFQCCSSLESFNISDGITLIDRFAFNLCSLTTITLPDSVEAIGKSAFASNYLVNVSIGSGLKSIDETAFDYCAYLESFFISSDNPYLKTIDGVIYSANTSQLIRSPDSVSKSSFTIPDTVTYIAPRAFSGCSSLRSIKIPQSVSYIGYEAFEDCMHLMDASYNGTKDPEHGPRVFKSSDKLQKVFVPAEYEGETFCDKPILRRVPTSLANAVKLSSVITLVVIAVFCLF